jgi:putative transposase
MKIIRGYKTELDPNNKEATALYQHAGAARFVWNWALDRIQNKISQPNAMKLHKEWNEWKRENAPWYEQVSKCSPQESLRNLERAFGNFFRKCKGKKAGTFKGKVGFPKFKAKHRGIGSFRLTGTIHVNEKSIQLPKLGELRLKEHGYIPTDGIKILSATVSEHAGRWFVSVQCEQEITDPQPKQKNIVGVDLGIKTLATVSDGTKYENPKALRSRLKKLKRLSKAVSRKVKGSSNRKKAARHLAKLHYKISNIRKDTLNKMTTHLTKTKSCIGIEDLNVSGMMKNHCLAQSIADLGLGEWRRQLEYKGKLYGCGIALADRFFPSSKLCHICGCIKDDLTLADRTWVCVCGAKHDRDFNASKNLEKLAVSSTDRINAYG